jgi:hypothetical protein
MPHEIRRLVFTYPEVTDAIISYGKKYNINFPAGQITRAKFASPGDFEHHTMKDFNSPLHRTYNVQQKRKSMILSLFDQTTLEHKNFNLTADFVAGALIEYCLDKQLVLPKDASKEIDITDFHLCMDIKFDNPLEQGGSVMALDDAV